MPVLVTVLKLPGLLKNRVPEKRVYFQERNHNWCNLKPRSTKLKKPPLSTYTDTRHVTEGDGRCRRAIPKTAYYIPTIFALMSTAYTAPHIKILTRRRGSEEVRKKARRRSEETKKTRGTTNGRRDGHVEGRSIQDLMSPAEEGARGRRRRRGGAASRRSGRRSRGAGNI